MSEPSKVCVVCGTDCAGKPRTRDPQGRYYCQACYDDAMRRRSPAAAETSDPIAPLSSDQAEGYVLEPDPQARTAPPPIVDALEIAASSCPYCATPLGGDARMCHHCGAVLSTAPGFTVAPARPDDTLWPTVIGIMSIIVGVVTCLIGLCNGLGGLLQPGGAASSAERSGQIVGAVMGMLIWAGFAAWVIVCGVGVMRRRRWSRSWIIGWATTQACLACGCLMCVGGFVVVAGSELEAGAGTPLAVIIIGLILFGLWMLGWPAFILCWFLRRRIRSEVLAWD